MSIQQLRKFVIYCFERALSSGNDMHLFLFFNSFFVSRFGKRRGVIQMTKRTLNLAFSHKTLMFTPLEFKSLVFKQVHCYPSMHFHLFRWHLLETNNWDMHEVPAILITVPLSFHLFINCLLAYLELIVSSFDLHLNYVTQL